jgi:hypothetical protein
MKNAHSSTRRRVAFCHRLSIWTASAQSARDTASIRCGRVGPGGTTGGRPHVAGSDEPWPGGFRVAFERDHRLATPHLHRKGIEGAAHSRRLSAGMSPESRHAFRSGLRQRAAHGRSLRPGSSGGAVGRSGPVVQDAGRSCAVSAFGLMVGPVRPAVGSNRSFNCRLSRGRSARPADRTPTDGSSPVRSTGAHVRAWSGPR